MITQALILAGGRGSRLGKLTKNTPKPLVDVSEKPFIEYLIWNIARQGIEEIFIMTGYKSNVFYSKYHQKKLYGAKIEILDEDDPLGTAGCITINLDRLNDNFWVFNGDSYFDCNLLSAHKAYSYDDALIVGTKSNETDRFGSIKFNKDMIVEGFIEKNASRKGGIINSGIYIFSKKLFYRFKDGYLSMEHDVLPELVKTRNLKIYIDEGYFIDIGVPSSYKKANIDFPEILTKPALFLDRDGTINVDNGYTYKVSDLRLINGAEKAIKNAVKKGFYIIIITNQGGIAKGLYTKKDMLRFNKALINKLRSSGANIDFIYYCHHHPDALDVKDRKCNCRKPLPGLIKKALADLPINRENSFMIGDKDSDIQAGESAGVKSFLFNEKDLNNFLVTRGVI